MPDLTQEEKVAWEVVLRKMHKPMSMVIDSAHHTKENAATLAAFRTAVRRDYAAKVRAVVEREGLKRAPTWNPDKYRKDEDGDWVDFQRAVGIAKLTHAILRALDALEG